MISIDTEGTGLDVFHGAAPFFVTTCREDGTQVFYEWSVDPETRIVDVPDSDRDEIRELVSSTESIIGQNIKYDSSLLIQYGVLESWPWDKTHDTLVAGHLLASNQPHDLTSMAIHYLGVDIEPYEKALEVACKDARRMVQQAQLRLKRKKGVNKLGPCDLFDADPEDEFPADSERLARFRIAGPDQPDMPSAKEKSWKYDGWLPKALAKELGYADDHPWQTVLRDYGNADSAVTLALWKVMREELHRRGLYSIYLEKLKNLAHVYDMQRVGVTVLVPSLNRLETEYEGEYERMENRCVEIAKGLDYDLTLPKGSANNKSLSTFLFETLKLPVRKWTPTGNPAFDKDVIEDYRRTLEGTPLEFIKNLSGKRKRGKSLEFMTTYRRYGIRNGRGGVLTLHSNLNPTATATTRFSCDNPNLQQCSKQETACEICKGEGCEECGYSGEDLHSVRQIFGPGPGREWWTADAENIELRIPAYRSGQKELIELFERPKDPPFYGSQHLLNFSVVYPDVWTDALLKVGIDEVGPYVKKKCASDYYQWCKNGNFACVPMNTEALTASGWKSYDLLNEGDYVLGHENGSLRWTKVLEKFKFHSADLMEISNKHFRAVVTPDHRWIGKKWTGFKETLREEECVFATQALKKHYTVYLSATVQDTSSIDITDTEAAIIGFAYSDGTIVKSEKGSGPSRGLQQNKVGFRVRLWQSKPAGVEFIEKMLAEWGGKFRRSEKSTGMKEWELSPDLARNIWKRAGLWDSQDFEKFVRDIGTTQRQAFLDAVFAAEGNLDGRGNTRMFTQNRGPFCDGIVLAIFMNGGFPTVCNKKTTYPTSHQCLSIRECKPYVTGQRIVKRTLPGKHDVWCIKTALGSWVMRQNGQIMLTGNCQYQCGEATADRAFHRSGAFRTLKSAFAQLESLNQYYVAFAEKYGYVETLPDKTVNPQHGYPLMCARTEYGRILSTLPLNYMSQGTAGWWMVKAINRCGDQLKEWRAIGFDAWMVLTVHDELVFDFPLGGKRNLPKMRRLQQLMQQGGEDIGVPTPVSVSYHPRNWAEKVKL